MSHRSDRFVLAGMLALSAAAASEAAPPRYNTTDITSWTLAQKANLPFFKHYVPVPPATPPAGGTTFYYFPARTALGLHAFNTTTLGTVNTLAALLGPSGSTPVPPFGTFAWWHCCPPRSANIEVVELFDVNHSGAAVGRASMPGSGVTSGQTPDYHAFVFSNGAKTDLTPDSPLGVATCINNRGEIAGYANGTGSPLNSGFRRSADGSITALDFVPPGYLAQPRWINARGDIIGTSVPGSFASPAGSSAVFKLPTLFGMPLATASDINDAGWIVGTSESWDHTERYATLWEPNPDGTWTPRDLTDLINTPDILLDRAVAINNAGQIIVAGHPDGGDVPVGATFLITPTSGTSTSCIPDLGIHPSDALACIGTAVLQVLAVGGSLPMTYQWQFEDPESGDWVGLADGPLTSGDSAWGTVSGAHLAQCSFTPASGASSLRFRCQVSNSCGVTESNPASITPCAADFNCSGDITVQDLFDFLAAYFSSAPASDFNASGSITVQDIFDYLAAWFTGCP